ncbi:MAG: HPr family phosphocarrier protein [Spirochaetes bacterium]|nr:HPr family phosphocarrier protein [Spirochaetota bacterium]
MKEHAVVVKWRAGLHARRAVDLVKISNKFESSITIKKDDIDADAKSIINIMTLEASYKTVLNVIVEGVDEDEALKSIIEYFSNITE